MQVSKCKLASASISLSTQVQVSTCKYPTVSIQVWVSNAARFSRCHSNKLECKFGQSQFPTTCNRPWRSEPRINSRKRWRNRPTAQRANVNSRNRSFRPLAAAPAQRAKKKLTQAFAQQPNGTAGERKFAQSQFPTACSRPYTQRANVNSRVLAVCSRPYHSEASKISRKRLRNRPTARRANANSRNLRFWPLAAAPSTARQEEIHASVRAAAQFHSHSKRKSGNRSFGPLAAAPSTASQEKTHASVRATAQGANVNSRNIAVSGRLQPPWP